MHWQTFPFVLLKCNHRDVVGHPGGYIMFGLIFKVLVEDVS